MNSVDNIHRFATLDYFDESNNSDEEEEE